MTEIWLTDGKLDESFSYDLDQCQSTPARRERRFLPSSAPLIDSPSPRLRYSRRMRKGQCRHRRTSILPVHDLSIPDLPRPNLPHQLTRARVRPRPRHQLVRAKRPCRLHRRQRHLPPQPPPLPHQRHHRHRRQPSQHQRQSKKQVVGLIHHLHRLSLRLRLLHRDTRHIALRRHPERNLPNRRQHILRWIHPVIHTVRPPRIDDIQLPLIPQPRQTFRRRPHVGSEAQSDLGRKHPLDPEDHAAVVGLLSAAGAGGFKVAHHPVVSV